MVGHTGNFAATVKAIEALDGCLGRILEALQEVDGEALITADHGNAEKMSDEDTGQAHTAHTTNPVPLIYVGSRQYEFIEGNGALSDVAPTMLYLMGIEQPHEMSGHNLLEEAVA
jgi:2,3-bisphosphoglycerate-independent phosphoglycerate mutase